MKYKNRYTDKAKQNAYMNACDCLYFGFGKIFWNDCGCNDDLLGRKRGKLEWDYFMIHLLIAGCNAYL